MNNYTEKIIWLNSWETNKQYNVEIGFDNHALLRGYIKTTNFSDLSQLPNVNFFLSINNIKPNLYNKNKITYGEITCYINNEKYKVIYYYEKSEYLVTDKNDTIVKKIIDKI